METRRLILRPVELVDAEQLQRLFGRWDNVQYLSGVPWPYPDDGARTWCESVALPEMERGDGWHWTLRLKSAPDQLIGGIGLKRIDGDNRGFWIGREWRGQGLMSEAVEPPCQ